METKREWTTIKEYEEILFDFYNGIAASLSTANAIATLSHRLQQQK